MQIAQKLYEGLPLANGTEGLISYMRTDSTRLSDIFVKDAEDTSNKHMEKNIKEKPNKKTAKTHRMPMKLFARHRLHFLRMWWLLR